MTIVRFPDGFDPTRSVLFLGSGFTGESKNRLSSAPPVGDGLRIKILEGINEVGLEDDLKDVAHYAVKKGFDLHGLLNDLFVIDQVGPNQEQILEKKWRMIYTTNYDDCAERYDLSRPKVDRRKTFSIEDARPAKLPPGSIVHLHGYIHNCDTKNILSQLVLDHHSYARQVVSDSPWWSQFERDLRGAQNVFFLGYSLSDFAVASYLTKNPDYARKIHFILRPPVTDVLVSRLSEYGAIHQIAVSGFAHACKAAVSASPLSSLLELTSFLYLDPYKDNKSAQKPTPLEIDALLTRGKINQKLLSQNHSVVSYIIPRRGKIGEAIEKLDRAATLIIHSRTANGKTIFGQLLASELHSRGYTCVRFKGHASVPPQEVAFLSEIARLCVFFNTYDDAISISDELQPALERAKFVVEINTGTDQIRRSEIQAGLPRPVFRVELNSIAKSDILDFQELLDDSGIASVDISPGSGVREIRDVLIKILESPFVIDKIDSALRPLLDSQPAKRVVAVMSVLKALGIHVEMDYVRAVIQSDPYDALLGINEASSEFADFTENDIFPHSAVFSEFFLKKYIGGQGIAEVVARLAIEAAKRVNASDSIGSQRKREARRALGALMQFKNLEQIFDGFSNREALILNLYEDLRDSVNINKEPLFWLQYSIFMQATGEYPLAKKHMDVAYERAARIPGFQTFQLDTKYLKLILHTPSHLEISQDTVEELFPLLEKVRAMILAEDHRLHAFRVLEDLEVFARIRGAALAPGERQRLSIICLGIIGDLSNLPIGDQIEFGTDTTRSKVQGAISILASY